MKKDFIPTSKMFDVNGKLEKSCVATRFFGKNKKCSVVLKVKDLLMGKNNGRNCNFERQVGDKIIKIKLRRKHLPILVHQMTFTIYKNALFLH